MALPVSREETAKGSDYRLIPALPLVEHEGVAKAALDVTAGASGSGVQVLDS